MYDGIKLIFESVISAVGKNRLKSQLYLYLPQYNIIYERRAVSSQSGESLRKWLKIKFCPKIFRSLLYIIHEFSVTIPKPSPRGQVLETALYEHFSYYTYGYIKISNSYSENRETHFSPSKCRLSVLCMI